MARVRSPNYPSISLPNAIEKIRAIHKLDGRNAVSRAAVAQHMGFNGLHGTSSGVLSALGKYGLLETLGDQEVRVSELAMKILHSHDDNEKNTSLNEAAFKPALFAELKEKWPEQIPTDNNLRSYLMRKEFSTGAAEQIIQFYRETFEMAFKSIEDDTEILQEKNQHNDKSLNQDFLTSIPTTNATNFDLGKPFTVAFDGDILTGTIAIKSVKDIERLIKVLTAQKAAFEAMQDDDKEN